MSLVFSNPTLKSGICERIDKRLGTTLDSYSMADKVSDINSAMDRALLLIFKAGGRWQFDDSNQTDYPIIVSDLNAGQRDYTFVKDSAGNLILDIYKVMVMDQNGIYRDMKPTDMQSNRFDQSFYDGQNVQGIPTKYDKTANGIFMDVVPSYSQVGGIKIFINREGTYFNASDTTKVPGFAGTLHEYLVISPAYKYASANSLAQAGGVLRNGARTGLFAEMYDWEGQIDEYYGQREKDTRKVLRGRQINFR